MVCFLENSGALNLAESQARVAVPRFLEMLEVTQMTRSFKMVLLLALLKEERFPGSIPIPNLVAAVRRYTTQHPKVGVEFGDDLQSDTKLRRNLERNRISAWTGGASTGGERYFSYQGGGFSSTFQVADEHRSAFQELAREIAEWRLAEYLDRASAGDDGSYVLNVSHANGRPILFLNRDKNSGLPEGWTPIEADGEQYKANFVKVAVNVVRMEGSDENQLPSLLRGWFGQDAGAPGTRHRVKLTLTADGRWILERTGPPADLEVN